MRRTFFLLPLAALLVVGGCAATKEAQVRSALLDAGMSANMAGCMAEPLGRELSIGQLKSIQRVAKLAQTSPKQMTQKQIMDLLKRDLDPETVAVIARAGIGCFFRG